MKDKGIKVDLNASNTFEILRDTDSGIHAQVTISGIHWKEHWALLHKQYNLNKKHRYLYDFDTKRIHDRGEVK